MKKFLMLIALISIITMSVFAADDSSEKKSSLAPERTESKWTELSYVNVPILKIYEGKDGYAIIYQKNRAGTGYTVIPKAWAKGNPENPRKLKFRNSKQNSTSYMTVVKDKGEFKRVILTIPMNKALGLWGVVDTRKGLEGADKETLEELEL